METYPSRRSLNRRLVRLSRLAAAGCRLAWLAGPAMLAAYCFLLPEAAARHPWLAHVPDLPAALGPAAAACLLAGLLVATGPLLWGMTQLEALFRGYGAGEVLTVQAASRFNRFALALLAGVPAGPLGSAVATGALSLAGHAGAPFLAVSVGSDQFWLLILGSVLLLIARVMLDAAMLAADDAQIV